MDSAKTVFVAVLLSVVFLLALQFSKSDIDFIGRNKYHVKDRIAADQINISFIRIK